MPRIWRGLGHALDYAGLFRELFKPRDSGLFISPQHFAADFRLALLLNLIIRVHHGQHRRELAMFYARGGDLEIDPYPTYSAASFAAEAILGPTWRLWSTPKRKISRRISWQAEAAPAPLHTVKLYPIE